MRRTQLLVSVVSLMLWLPVIGLTAPKAQREEVKTEKSIAAQSLDAVDVGVKIGSIRAMADGGDTVRIEAVRYAEGGTPEERQLWLHSTHVEIESQGRKLILKDVVPDNLMRGHHEHNFKMGLDVTIHSPAHVDLTLNTGVGDVTAEGAAGALKVDNGVGKVHLTHLRCAGKTVSIQSGAGNVALDGQTGNLKVNVGAGTLNLQGVDCSGQTVLLESGAGDITLSLLNLPGSSLKIHAGVGHIKTSLPSSARAGIELSSGMGAVNSALPLEGRHKTGGMGGTLSGALNGGGVPVRIDVGVGEVSLVSEGRG